MKENLMHIVKKDKKKLLLLSVLAVAAVLLMVIGGRSGASSEEKTVAENPSADASSDPLSAADDLGADIPAGGFCGENAGLGPFGTGVAGGHHGHGGQQKDHNGGTAPGNVFFRSIVK